MIAKAISNLRNAVEKRVPQIIELHLGPDRSDFRSPCVLEIGTNLDCQIRWVIDSIEVYEVLEDIARHPSTSCVGIRLTLIRSH